MEEEMKIAIIGGGKRCRTFLEMFDARRFPKLRAEIVAVADPDPEAVGLCFAREKKIYTTADYQDFYKLKDLDLVIELTGKEWLLADFLRNKPARVRVLESAISRIFGDILQLREEYLFTKRHVNLVEGIMNSLFIGLRDWVLVMQPDLKLLDANDAFLNAVQAEREDIVGKVCYQAAFGLTQRCGSEGFDCPVQKCLETGAVAHAIMEGTGPAYAGRYYEITAVPLQSGNNQIELVVECFRDITDELERRVEQKVLTLKQDLTRLIHEEKMISLGKLAAGAVHEINNPLAGINAIARLMQQELESGETDSAAISKYVHYLDLISTESARCSRIVRDLLQFARQGKAIHNVFQLNDVVRNAVHFVKYRLDSQQITSSVELDPKLPPMTGDQSQLQQCLLNLIFNAIDAMPNGGRLVVQTGRDRRKRQIRLHVSDTGTGIPKDVIPLIFEPFFSTKSRDKGVGLGLSVVYGIVKEHGGSVYVNSEEGAGARFTLRFPIS